MTDTPVPELARGVTIQPRGSSFTLRVRNDVLTAATGKKYFFQTFDTEPEAADYGNRLAAALAQGIVPAEILTPAKPAAVDNPPLAGLVREYLNLAPTLTKSDSALLASSQFIDDLAHARFVDVSFAWSEAYVRRLKGRQLSPSTIRIRVGALGRVLDWHLRRITAQGERPPANAMRLLPKGYSVYNATEAEAIKAKGEAVPRSIERNRRLTPEEEQRIRQALAGVKLAGRQTPRKAPDDAHLGPMFELIVDTGMRLREAYTARAEDFDFERGLIHVRGSKGRGGQIKPRMVPMKPELRGVLLAYLGGRTQGIVFPFWNGEDDEALHKQVSRKLTKSFAGLFAYANVEDFSEHDLRHEATCRWVTQRDARSGAWLWAETELCRIMGWTSTRMLMRYASLRGEDLADRLALAYAAPPQPAAPRAVVNAAPGSSHPAKPAASGAGVHAFSAERAKRRPAR
jgi:integrase